jgi:hypothetical protein
MVFTKTFTGDVMIQFLRRLRRQAHVRSKVLVTLSFTHHSIGPEFAERSRLADPLPIDEEGGLLPPDLCLRNTPCIRRVFLRAMTAQSKRRPQHV